MYVSVIEDFSCLKYLNSRGVQVVVVRLHVYMLACLFVSTIKVNAESIML